VTETAVEKKEHETQQKTQMAPWQQSNASSARLKEYDVLKQITRQAPKLTIKDKEPLCDRPCSVANGMPPNEKFGAK
jgi:hypothetical protein